MRPENDDVEGWTEVFRQLGSHEPEYWGKMQVEDASRYAPLHLYLFIKTLKACVERPDPFWVNVMATEPGLKLMGPPSSTLQEALQRARAAGVSDEDLADIAWGAQHHAIRDLFSVLQYFEQPDEVQEVVGRVTWSLVADDQDGKPTSLSFGEYLEDEYDDYMGYTKPPDDHADGGPG